MENLGPFTLYTPVAPAYDENASLDDATRQQALKIETLLKNGIAFLQTDSENDWYDSQAQFSSDTLKVVYDASGIICSSDSDASRLWPLNLSVAEIATADVPDGFAVNRKWMYSDGSIIARVYTSAELLAQAENTRTDLISSARETMNEWQNDLALGDISDSDKALLTTWNTYVKALKALDLSTAPDITWPDVPSATTTTTTDSNETTTESDATSTTT